MPSDANQQEGPSMETASQRLSAGVDSASAKHDGALPLDIVARRAAGKVPAPGATPHLLRRLHRARLLPAALALVMLGGRVGI
jgi:hypothetical protein